VFGSLKVRGRRRVGGSLKGRIGGSLELYIIHTHKQKGRKDFLQVFPCLPFPFKNYLLNNLRVWPNKGKVGCNHFASFSAAKTSN